METATNGIASTAASSKHFARRLVSIGENRLELLTVEVQQELERLLYAFLLALSGTTLVCRCSTAFEPLEHEPRNRKN